MDHLEWMFEEADRRRKAGKESFPAPRITTRSRSCGKTLALNKGIFEQIREEIQERSEVFVRDAINRRHREHTGGPESRFDSIPKIDPRDITLSDSEKELLDGVEQDGPPQVGDRYATLWVGCRKVGRVSVSAVKRLGDDYILEYGIYLQSDFVAPGANEEPYEQFMGDTTDPELWFRMRSYGKINISKYI